MAVAYIPGVPVIRITASGDSISIPVTLKAVKFVHGAPGSVRIAAGSSGSSGQTIYFTTTTGVYNPLESFPDPVYLPNGLKVVSMTGTELLLYV